MHERERGGEAAYDGLGAWDGGAVEVELVFVLDDPGDDEAPGAGGDVVRPDGSEVRERQALAVTLRLRMHDGEPVEVDCGVGDVGLGQEVGGFGEDGGLAGAHGAGDDQEGDGGGHGSGCGFMAWRRFVYSMEPNVSTWITFEGTFSGSHVPDASFASNSSEGIT